VVETPEIVRILETEPVEFIVTTHSQTIFIRLKDGREYRGTYVHAQAGTYSGDAHLYDILNLVLHIKKKRPPEEAKECHRSGENRPPRGGLKPAMFLG
jgi:hypothetical protein